MLLTFVISVGAIMVIIQVVILKSLWFFMYTDESSLNKIPYEKKKKKRKSSSF